MTAPLVSVIVPVWNTVRFLPACLDSLVSQTLRDIEIICVNDASTDASLQVLGRYAAEDPRIRVFSHERNLGPGAARNRGIDLARGNYIGFVDSDDLISPDFYQNLYQGALIHNTDITITCCTVYDDSTAPAVFGNSQNVIAELKQRWVHNVRGMARAFGAAWHENRDFSGQRAALSAFPSVVDKLYRRSLFDEVRFPEGVLFEDMLFMPQVMFHASRVFSCPGGEYYYRRNKASITRRKDFRALLEKLVVAGMLDQWVGQQEMGRAERSQYEALVGRKYRQAIKSLVKKTLIWTPGRVQGVKEHAPDEIFRFFFKRLAAKFLMPPVILLLLASVVKIFMVK
ncbi:MAG: glycosyltransferase [Oryzomonas sp.]|uniref:glycosyltransferase family 2 protein n=1 Tax=Oryzomonas sp. TaxID=2855186 RepID=UPI00284C32CF|nr:glycosyltransferase [Oryzomonas sp.]MDR3580674.1 glycosyltransferase [Oryzomonas sp.]